MAIIPTHGSLGQEDCCDCDVDLNSSLSFRSDRTSSKGSHELFVSGLHLFWMPYPNCLVSCYSLIPEFSNSPRFVLFCLLIFEELASRYGNDSSQRVFKILADITGYLL